MLLCRIVDSDNLERRITGGLRGENRSLIVPWAVSGRQALFFFLGALGEMAGLSRSIVLEACEWSGYLIGIQCFRLLLCASRGIVLVQAKYSRIS